MLLTNQRLDNLAASRVNFAACGMLTGPLLTSDLPPEPPPAPHEDNEGDADAVAGITSLGDVKLAHNPGVS